MAKGIIAIGNVSVQYAVGGIGLASHVISSISTDPEFVQQLEKWRPGVGDVFLGAGR